MALCKECEKQKPGRRAVYYEYIGQHNGGERIRKIKLRLCEECLREEGLYCDLHGPCDLTNSPQMIMACSTTPEEDEDLVFCRGCIQDLVTELNSQDYSDYVTLLRHYYDSEYLDELSEFARFYFPRRRNQDVLLLLSFALVADLMSLPLGSVILNNVEGYKRQVMAAL